MKQVKIIHDNELVGLGSTILRGLHRLYYRNSEDILYFNFTNELYAHKGENVWNKFLHQPFENDRKFIEIKYKEGNIITEHGFRDNNKLLFCYGGEQNNGEDFKNREKVTEYRQVVDTYIKFKQSITDKVSNFYDQFLYNKNTLSIHCRGTDQYTSRGHAGNTKHLLNFEYIKQIINSRDFDQIFLATDEEATLKKFKNEYGDKIITYATLRCEENNTTGLHYSNQHSDKEIKYRMGEEMIIDMMLMSKCNYSYYVRSNVSLLSILMRTDFNYNFYDDHINYNNLG
jgi:hypothetical protein